GPRPLVTTRRRFDAPGAGPLAARPAALPANGSFGRFVGRQIDHRDFELIGVTCFYSDRLRVKTGEGVLPHVTFSSLGSAYGSSLSNEWIFATSFCPIRTSRALL